MTANWPTFKPPVSAALRSSLRVLFVLPGLHRVVRGAEVAFESIARELAAIPGMDVTLIGAGQARDEDTYRFIHVPCVPREKFRHWPAVPCFRGDCMYEEATFAPGLLRAYRPGEFDVTVTCSYPYTNWVLRARNCTECRPAHVYVTQNGDWPAVAGNREYRFFGCDGLVCTNPEYLERNRSRWFCELIPNGVDPARFSPGCAERERLGLSSGVPIVLIVSALIPSKRVLEGIRCVAKLPDVHLVVAGAGPLQKQVEETGHGLLRGRFLSRAFRREEMPALYRSSDVFLHMSQDEPSANAYMEALASGLAIVTHDRLVTRWTLEKVAWLVDTNVETAVAEAIRSALEANRQERAQLGQEIVERRFTWRAIARQYADFFRRVIERRARAMGPAA